MIGSDASPAIPRILASIQSPQFFVRSREKENYYVRTEAGLAIARMGPAGKQALGVRDAVWGASITLLAGGPPGRLVVPQIVEIERRTWIPLEGQGSIEVQKAINRIDPMARFRAGLPPVERPAFLEEGD